MTKDTFFSSKKANNLTKGEETEKYALIGKYAFLACVIIAIIAGLAIGYMVWDYHVANPTAVSLSAELGSAVGYTTLVLLILGIIVGLVNIAAKEVTPFLIAAIALSVTKGAAFQIPLSYAHALLGWWASFIIDFIVAFVAPAAIILAIKAIYSLARGK